MDLFHNEIISFCLRKATIKLAAGFNDFLNPDHGSIGKGLNNFVNFHCQNCGSPRQKMPSHNFVAFKYFSKNALAD
jgi:hypothetical protein